MASSRASSGQPRWDINRARRWIEQQCIRVKEHFPSMLKFFTVEEGRPNCLSCNKKLPEGEYGFCSAQCYWNSLQKFRIQVNQKSKGKLSVVVVVHYGSHLSACGLKLRFSLWKILLSVRWFTVSFQFGFQLHCLLILSVLATLQLCNLYYGEMKSIESFSSS